MIMSQSFSGSTIQTRPTSVMPVSVTRFVMSETAGTTPSTPFCESTILADSSAGVWNEYLFSSSFDSGVSYECTTPSTAEFSGARLIPVGDGGVCEVVARLGARQQVFSLNTKSTSTTVYSFDGYESGTIARILADGVLSRITGAEQITLYSGWAPVSISTPPTALNLNPSCWAYGIDLSGIPAWTTYSGNYSHENKGCAITKRHVAAAKHWGGVGGRVGMKFVFRGNTGTLHERTVIGLAYAGSDIVVFTLDSDLPTDVSVIPVVGDWFARNRSRSGDFLSTYNGGVYFYVDQTYSCRLLLGSSITSLERHYSPASGLTLNGNTYSEVLFEAHFAGNMTVFSSYTPSILAGKTSYFRDAISGDSGSPVMCIIGSQPSVITSFLGSSYGPFWGESDGAFINDAISLADDAAGVTTGYTVTVTPDPTL